jgi:hypothetical protein
MPRLAEIGKGLRQRQHGGSHTDVVSSGDERAWLDRGEVQLPLRLRPAQGSGKVEEHALRPAQLSGRGG